MVLKTLTEIAQGWYNYFKGTPETKQMMDARLRECDVCPNKRQLNPAGQLLIKAINQESSTYYCVLCTCPLAGMTANPNKKCKAGRWGKWKQESYYP